MYRLAALPALCFALLLTAPWLAAQGLDIPEDVSVLADFTEFDPKTKEAVLSGNVTITYLSSSLKADKVWINTETQDVYASGNVVVDREGDTWKGDYVQGNLKEQSLSFNEHYTVVDDWHISGSGASRMADGRLIVNDATISPCNQVMRLQTGKVLYHPDGRFRANNVVYKIGGVPVFYVPVIWGDLDNDYRGLEFRAGYESDNGGMFRLAKRWRMTPDVTNKLGVNYYTNRGFGIDNKLVVKHDKSTTDLYLWGQMDDDPLYDRRVGGEKYNGRYAIEDEHYRIQLHHRTDFTDRLTMQVHGDYLSDSDVLYDFFEQEYRDMAQPPNFADLSYLGDNFTVSLNARAQLNDFFTVAEKLPELKLTVPRQQLLNTALQYQGESSGARLRMKWREYDLPTVANAQRGIDYETTRFDTMHFLFLPLKLGHFDFTPRVGGRVTWYENSSTEAVSNDELNKNFGLDIPRGAPTVVGEFKGYNEAGGEQTNAAAEVGFELRTKLHSTWDGIKNEHLGIDGVRHVVEPYLKHTYISDPDVSSDELYFFDEIDRVDETHFTRIGIEQRFQTRRDKRIYTFARIETYYDFYHETEADEDEAGDFGLVIDVAPTEDIQFWWHSLVNAGDGRFNVSHLGARYGDNEKFFFDIAYLYQDNFKSRYNYSMVSELTQVLTMDYFPIVYDENESVRLSAGMPINDKTTVRAHLFFDLEAGSLVRQRYELLRDLNCWMASLSFEKEEDELEAYLLFYLKSLPNFGLGFGN